MAGGRYDERVQDLLDDAEASAARGDWAAVRDLAGAVLALASGNAAAAAAAQELRERADEAAPSSGERRQLTVMFCDVVGSTALSQEHDPELVREVLRSYQVTCDRVVRRYEGRVARFIGDGVLAYFGHPVAHEDDARRGVKAGLDLLQALRPVVDEVRERYEIDLRIRVAVHTGLVVRADMGSAATPDRDAIVGDTPNIAARLQDHAAPGTLVISHDTFELVRPWFLVAPRGELELKGIDRPVTAYEVVDESPDDARVHAQADLSPFVGRAEELEVLLEAWEDVRKGEFRAVAISGQPGVGKSRLADVLRRRVEADDGTARLVPCSSYHGSTALHPIRRLLERVAGIEPHQDPDVSLAKLWTSMESVGQADALPMVASLLDLPPTAWCPAPELDGPKLREQLLSTLVRWVRAATERGSLLLVVDDLQWADPTTQELLGRVIADPIPGLLLVATIREDTKVPWNAVTVLSLERLSADHLGDLARRSPEGRRLDDDHLEQLIERSDGIPLYLEELLRNAALANGGVRADSAIPAGLRDLLLARFAAPGVDLGLAQVLATIGPEASLPLVATVSGVESSLLDLHLSALVDAGIVEVVPGDPPAYRFRHHLLAELAYETQLQTARRRSHGVVADAFLAGPSDIPMAAPTVLAHHLEEAGRPAEAIRFLASAAEAAHALGANTEVGELLARAMGLLEVVGADERPMLEFDVRLIRATNASTILGFAAPQAIEDFAVCRELVAGQVGAGGYLDDEGVAYGQEVLWAATGLWATFLLQGRIQDADEVNRNLVAQLNPAGGLHDYFQIGRCYVDFFEGDYRAATAGLEASTVLAPGALMPERLTVPSDPRATAMAHLSFCLGVQCRFDEARVRCDEAVAYARTIAFPVGPFSLCYVLSMRCSLEVMAGDIDASRVYAAELAEVADRHGYTFWTLLAGYYDAYLDLCKGAEGAMERCEMSLLLLQSVGVHIWAPYFRAAVTAAHLRAGATAAAFASLTAATEVAEQTGAHYWSAEIARQDGEVRLASGDDSGIDRLRDAVALAQAQGATLHELTARTSLARATGDAKDLGELATLLEGAAAGAPEPVAAAARAALAPPP